MPDVDLLLDTDILVDLLRKYAPAVRWAGQNSASRLTNQGAVDADFSLAPDSSSWALQFDEGYTYDMAGPGPLGSWHYYLPRLRIRKEP